MPPSRHSSSSHSSASRSSGRSHRSPSAHSASSHSSSSASTTFRSPFAGGKSSPFRGPGSHASDSHSSRPASPAKPAQSPWKPRVNQPTGYVAATHERPTYYYGKHHSYAYYPQSWTDTETGARFEKGYYDENGLRYDSVAFAKNGRYENVLCHCPYCGQDSLLSLNVEGAGLSLRCPNCGGPTELQTQLDELVPSPGQNTHVYNAEESLKPFFDGVKKKKRRSRLGWIIAVLVLAAALAIVKNATGVLPVLPGFSSQETRLGKTLYLQSSGENAYTLTGKADTYSKTLAWDADADSYFDSESVCWLWYNTDVEPPLWQYWYEGISSDYGDWGWMEYEDGVWYIEASQANWIALPADYSTENLWHLDG